MLATVVGNLRVKERKERDKTTYLSSVMGVIVVGGWYTTLSRLSISEEKQTAQYIYVLVKETLSMNALKRGLPRCCRSGPIQRKFASVVRPQVLRSNLSFREVEASTSFLQMKRHGHTANTRYSSTVLFKKLDWIVNARTGVVDGGNEEINYYSRDC